ncbi:recombination regulator RecX [Brackiella oedipodis]|uniref:recombination regulator RecX n=1 Tax=Brackiella oedipodis TaxID=124225 RepID=UPI00048C63CA|nr:recombination regulator RecX [Brackiella oedipodis]
MSQRDPQFQAFEAQLQQAAQPNQTNKVNLLAKAVAILSRREHSEAELRQKLLKFSTDRAEIDAVITRLQKENWQSDQRFVQAFVHSHDFKWGSRKILDALKPHDLSTQQIQEVQEQLRESEYDRAYAVWSRKFAHKPCLTLKDKAKQIRFLSARGFSADVVYKIVKLDHES